MTAPHLGQLDKVGKDLEIAADRYHAAHTSSAAATTKARDIAKDSAARQFQGIAKAMLVVVKRLEEAGGVIAAVMGDVRTVRQRAGGVPKDVNPDEVADRLNPLIEQLTTVRTRAMGVSTTLMDAEKAAKAALKGGQPGPLLGLIGQVRQRLQGASEQTEVARQGLEVVIKEARQTGNS